MIKTEKVPILDIFSPKTILMFYGRVKKNRVDRPTGTTHTFHLSLIHLCLHIGTFFFLSLSRFLHATLLHFLIASSVQIINDGQASNQQHYCSRWGRFMGRVCDYYYTGNQQLMQMK